jgi:hypothetical protein
MSAKLRLAALTTFALGCPAQIDPASTQPSKAVPKPIDENDPRVARIGDDLYPVEVAAKAQAMERREVPAAPAAEPTPPSDPTASPGTGKPDESNGVCRLYAPQLPNPVCCKAELGFDADVVAQECGLDLFLGESFQFTCGYYFHRAGTDPVWFRAAAVGNTTPKEVADDHDRKLQQLTKNPDFHSEEVPGVPGAWWSANEGVRWAFVPGWSRVRQLSWRDDACPRDKMARVLQKFIAAKEPPANAPRLGLVPKART